MVPWLLESLDRRWFTAEVPTFAVAWMDPAASLFLSALDHQHSSASQISKASQAMQHHCLRQLRRVAIQSPSRYFSTSTGLRRAFKEGDVVLLRPKKDAADGTLLKLQAAKTTHTHRGVVQHTDVIGKESRQIVRSSKGFEYRVHEPTLAEYVRLTPRLVTPVRLLPLKCTWKLCFVEFQLSGPSYTPLIPT